MRSTLLHLPKLRAAADSARVALLYLSSFAQRHIRLLKRTPARSPVCRRGEPTLLLSIATVVIGVSLVLLRSGQPTETDLRYLAAANVSMEAFKLPPTPATEARPTIAHAPNAHVMPISFAPAPLSREEGLKVVLATARSLIGTPYRYGASGPEAFDCSGFTSYVWRAAGLSLPHSSAAQYGSLPRVSINELQAGDLVFSGSGGVGHVGLYLGKGLMIDSPETGRNVEIEPLRGNLIGAARPALLLAPARKPTT